MIFQPTVIPGAFLVDLERFEDERGFFARTFCREEFAARGFETHVAQSSLSFNPRRGTLRGMHYQAPPHEEAKLVRCVRGAIHDVIVDLRPDSPAFTSHFAAVLSAENRSALYIPRGCAHGFLTLEDESEVHYQISTPYHPESARGVRWNDPAFGIPWPAEPLVIAERDRSYADFGPSYGP